MTPKDKTLNKQLIEHIDMLYKMINDIRNDARNSDEKIKGIKVCLTKHDKAIVGLSKKTDKLSKKED